MKQRQQGNQSRIHSLKEQVIQSQTMESIIHFWQALPRLHQRLLMVLLPLMLILLIWPTSKQEVPVQDIVNKPTEPSRTVIPLIIDGEETNATKPKPKVDKDEKRVQVSGPKTEEEQPKRQVSNNAGPEPWYDYTVQKGDTLSQVFRNNNLPLSDLTQLLEVQGKDKPLSYIQVGQLIRFRLNNRGELIMLRIEDEDSAVMFFRLASGGFYRSTN